MNPITSLAQAVDLSLDGNTFGEIDAQFEVEVEGKAWSCYTVSISHRDILCYCEEGTATFLVDSYGGQNRAELFDWEQDEGANKCYR